MKTWANLITLPDSGMDIPPSPQLPPNLFSDLRTIGYIVLSALLGLISAFAALLGAEGKIVTWRIVGAYILSGAVVSAGLTFVHVETYGFSYFLLGISTFAGYKAFDILAIAGVAVGALAKKLVGQSNSDKK